MMYNDKLEKLELDFNKISHISLKYFSKLLKSNKSLKHLSFEGNNLGKKSI